MSLEDLKDRVAKRAGRLKHGIDDTVARHNLERELDALFSELGIEVYQRARAGEPIEDSVVVRDLVDRIAQAEAALTRKRHEPDEEE